MAVKKKENWGYTPEPDPFILAPCIVISAAFVTFVIGLLIRWSIKLWQ